MIKREEEAEEEAGGRAGAGGRSSSRVSAPKLAVGMKEKEGRACCVGKGGKCDR